MSDVPETTRAFLAALTPEQQTALLALRAEIRKAAPEAEEYMGYGIPAFRQDGALVSFGAAKAHCAFYVQSPAVIEAFQAELAGMDTSKGTIRFKPDRPLDANLVHRIVRARLAENAARKSHAKAKSKP